MYGNIANLRGWLDLELNGDGTGREKAIFCSPDGPDGPPIPILPTAMTTTTTTTSTTTTTTSRVPAATAMTTALTTTTSPAPPVFECTCGLKERTSRVVGGTETQVGD